MPRIGLRPIPMDADYPELVRSGVVWVAEDGGNIAGLVVLIAHDDHVLVDNLAVEPSHQGRGIGRQLLAFAEEHARGLGLDEMRLYTHVKMTENQAIYARLGYR